MTAVIELGEDWALPEEVQPVPSGIPRAPLLMVALVLLAMLGGGARPAYRLVSLFSVPIEVTSTHTISGDTLYITHTRLGTHTREVSAYRLPDGTRKWTTTTDSAVGALFPVPAAGMVLAQFGGDSETTGVLALDGRTGRVRWRDDQAQVFGALPGSGRALLIHLDEVRAVDASSGRTVWQRPRGLGMGWAMPDLDPTQDVPPRLAFDGGDGVTEVVDAVTGAVLARARLESSWPEGTGVSSDGSVSVTTGGYLLAARSVVGGQLFVAQQHSASTVIDAYDLATLTHQWRASVTPPAFFVTACGAELCADGFTSMVGVDPRTGKVLWNNQQWRDARSLPGNRLLVSGSVANAPASVVDAADLRPLLPLPGWYPLVGAAPGARLVGRDEGGLRSWFAVLDPAGPALRPLGWAWGVQMNQCEYGDGYLACPTVDNKLRLWRYVD
jgi:outer membrane protein assembly factor BamB